MLRPSEAYSCPADSRAISHSKNAGGGFGTFNIQASGTGSTRSALLSLSITGVVGDSIYDYAIGNADETDEFYAAKILAMAINLPEMLAVSLPVRRQCQFHPRLTVRFCSCSISVDQSKANRLIKT
jgi:hypothetical protein